MGEHYNQMIECSIILWSSKYSFHLTYFWILRGIIQAKVTSRNVVDLYKSEKLASHDSYSEHIVFDLYKNAGDSSKSDQDLLYNMSNIE